MRLFSNREQDDCENMEYLLRNTLTESIRKEIIFRFLMIKNGADFNDFIVDVFGRHHVLLTYDDVKDVNLSYVIFSCPDNKIGVIKDFSTPISMKGGVFYFGEDDAISIQAVDDYYKMTFGDELVLTVKVDFDNYKF